MKKYISFEEPLLHVGKETRP